MLGGSSFGFIGILVCVFILAIIIFLLLTIRSNKKNGIKVSATITDIEKVESFDSEGYPTTEYVIMCSCDYEGIEESKLYYNYKLDYKKLKPGDKIDCIYDKKKKYFTTSENIKGTIIILLILVITLICLIIFNLIPELFQNWIGNTR